MTKNGSKISVASGRGFGKRLQGSKVYLAGDNSSRRTRPAYAEADRLPQTTTDGQGRTRRSSFLRSPPPTGTPPRPGADLGTFLYCGRTGLNSSCAPTKLQAGRWSRAHNRGDFIKTPPPSTLDVGQSVASSRRSAARHAEQTSERYACRSRRLGLDQIPLRERSAEQLLQSFHVVHIEGA